VLVCTLGITTMSDRVAGVGDSSLDRHAVEYLDAIARLGRLDPDSVDFHTGLSATDESRESSFNELAEYSRVLAGHLETTHARAQESRARAQALSARFNALAMRADQLDGRGILFDDELATLFAVNPHDLWQSGQRDRAAIVDEIGQRLPGPGTLSSRLDTYQRRFVVSRGRLHATVTRSVAICRERTRAYIDLPAGEEVAIEYVAERPWSGYSHYRGGYRSLLQINRALPLTVAQIFGLACHEGYPGHHAYNVIRDQELVQKRGRVEDKTLAIFSPGGFRAEALATAAAAMAFGPAERLRLFRDDLFPLAGLDPGDAETYVEVNDLLERLSSETTVIVGRYLAGTLMASEATTALRGQALMEHPEMLLRYVDRYRGYSLAYTFGRDRLLPLFSRSTPTEVERWALMQRLMLESDAPIP
jgi:hypothetical protein